MKDNSGRVSNRRKLFALGAGVAVLGLGVSATLAAWTDTEWVWGGDGAGAPGIGTSTFAVWQNTDPDFASPTWDDEWTDEAANPGGEMVFAPDALAMSPGDTVYAGVALQTKDPSVAGTLQLAAAVPATGMTSDAGLFAVMQVRVAVSTTPFACDAANFVSGTVIADGPLSSTAGSATQALAADGATTQYYCFEVSLPTPLVPVAPLTVDDYMGKTIAPAWQFVGTSS